jgi:dinuclear metal center YbgI/SA1388 family protein
MTSSFTVQNFIDILDDIAPFSQAAEWDNVGLMLGDPRQQISGILLGLDPTPDLLDQAIKRGANTILTHHPLIFHPLKNIRPDQPTGSLIKKGLVNELNILACHTNLDVVPDGVSDILARQLGLDSLVPLQPTGREENIGYGRLGTLAEPLAGPDFLARLQDILNLPVLPVAGQVPEMISKVAVCGGSGSDLAETAFNAGADVYITAEIKHATARWAEAGNLCIIDGSHFATENIIIQPLAARLQKILRNKNIDISIEIGEQENSIQFLTITGDCIERGN